MSNQRHTVDRASPIVAASFRALDDSEPVQGTDRKLTDTKVSIEGENMRSVTWVVDEEVKGGYWGIGGVPPSTEDVKKLAARE